jgi:DUF971 family protein
MAGLQSGAPSPQNITVHSQSRVLEISFSDGTEFRIPFELMRVYSPYAVQPTFSDGHESGIFSWDYLYFLGSQQDKLWADYTARLEAAGVDRDAPMAEKEGSSCANH